jgi:putative transposase
MSVNSTSMPRHNRVDVAGEVYHVVNRANGREFIFQTDDDYWSVISIIEETLKRYPLDIFSFCIMSNHWHFAVRPRENGDIGKFFGSMTQKVTQRWHAYHHSVGSGHLFQGRFRSFLVQTDSYFIQLMKYVESNPLRAKMVARAEDWKWSSLHLRLFKRALASKILADWPIEYTGDYVNDINLPMHESFLQQVRHSSARGTPLGEAGWIQDVVKKFGLEHTLRQRGRQFKPK